MKKLLTLLCAFALLFSGVLPVLAAEGNVIYSGDSGQCIFTPGSDYSPTDLFPDFKDVLPGDSITQTITVRNDATNKVKIKIYIRSLGAHQDSVEFLSQLHLRVEVPEDNEMGYMFDAAAHESAQLSDWVCLGTLYSGGVVNLNVILDVPVELDNSFQNLVGYLDWEFMIEEFPIDPDDPPPPTGDDYMIFVWMGLMVLSLAAVLFLLLPRKREDKQ